MKYKIRHLRCFWGMYKQTKYSIFDFLDNEYIGIILCYVLYYLISIIFIIPILIVVFIKYIKDIQIAKKHIKANNEKFIELCLQYKIITEKITLEE